MKNLLMKCIETFLIVIFLISKSFKWHNYSKFYQWESISHKQNLHGFLNQSHV